MEDVKISINPQGFPSQFVSDSVKDSLEFGLQIGQAIQYEWFRKDGGQSRFYNQWADFHRLRLYARGEQSIQKYPHLWLWSHRRWKLQKENSNDI